jgi:DNA topoisomerase-3
MMETAGQQVDDKALRAAMKESGLGTPATRAGLIETLLQRDYIIRQKKNIIATQKGHALIETIQFEDLKSPKLTGDWEFKLKLIEKGDLLAKDFIDEVKSYVVRIIESVKMDTGENKISSSIDLKESLGKCCLCGSEVVFKGKLYACENNEECKFVIWKQQFQKELKHDHVRQLLTQGRTETIKGLKKKDGTPFDAALKVSEGTIIPFFESSLKLGECPLCDSGEMSANQKVAKCNKCDYKLWRNIASVELSIDNLETLFQSGKTGVIIGFKSKEKNKSFSASLSLTESGELKFIFPKKNLSKMKYFAKKNLRKRRS